MGKADVQRQYSRAYADSQMYKAKYEMEGVTRAEELDAARLKLQARFEEAEQQIDTLNFKYASLEKSKLRLENDNSQKEVRNYSTELFRIKACYEENLASFD